MIRLAPPSVTVHFTRMVAHGEAGSHQGQEERNRTQIAHLDQNVALLAMVKPAVIVMAHTATSYTLGKEAEAKLVERNHSVERIRGGAADTSRPEPDGGDSAGNDANQ